MLAHSTQFSERNSLSRVVMVFRGLIAWVLALVCASLAGCKTLSLPAIDPTGNRIFLPNTVTGINPHHGPESGYPSQAPAFPTPPEPPACTQGGKGKLCQGCLAGKGCLSRKKEAEEIRGRCGQLLLTPTKIVAPVGGEVILLAGVCGKDEYLVTDEPIEWMLSPSSVGEFIEVGDDSKGQVNSVLKKNDKRPVVQKLDVDFARGRTSREPGIITKGTATKADDLPIRKGQTWISLTSAMEGVSKVTALAPDSDVWDKRRQTATIYWVDASWQFPDAQSVRSGQKAILTTRVMRSEGFAPAEGWEVRYRSLNPEFARFAESNQPKVTAKVDRNGVAQATLVNSGATGAGQTLSPFGTALVEIEIVKPTQGSENMPELSIAKGTTLVTFSSADLALNATGPEIAVPGQPLAYLISLANGGNLTAENTTVSVQIPTGLRVESTSYQPDPQATNNQLRWTIGPLEPRRVFEVSFTLIATAPVDARIQVDATATPDLRRSRTLSTLVQNPQLALQIAAKGNQSQFEIGGEAPFEVSVTNTGSQTINKIEILLNSDPGLPHIRGTNEAIQEIDFLAPGQSRRLDAAFIVQREGNLCVNATARSTGQVLSTNRACITGIPAVPKRPSLKFQLLRTSVQNGVPIGGKFEIAWALTNTGPVPLRSPVVSIQIDPNLDATMLSRGNDYDPTRRFGRWPLQDLAPGATIEFSGEFQGISASPQSSILLQVETRDGLSERITVPVPVGNFPAGSMPARSSQNGSSSPSDIGLSRPSLYGTKDLDAQIAVTIASMDNNLKQGDIGTYEVQIQSRNGKAQQQLVVQIGATATLEIVDVQSKDLRFRKLDTSNGFEVEPIQYLRPTDVVSIVVKAKVNGKGELMALATSKSQSVPTTERLVVTPR